MKTFIFACIFSLMTSLAGADLLSFNFRDPMFNPGPNTQSFHVNLPGTTGILFEALGPNNFLYWDTEDGIGVKGPSYSDDEIEGPGETLRLTFDYPVIVGVLEFTDLFYENEFIVGSSPPCFIHPWPTCYREQGWFSTNGGGHWYTFFAEPGQIRNLTNGYLMGPVGGVIDSILLRAPGAIMVPNFPYTQLHEFSLAELNIKTTPLDGQVPEPATLLTMGTGLLYIVSRSRKRVDG